MAERHSRTDSEPIPGYQILERLGAGGYGEVWKALAPGGIEKAVKFVHGDYDDERAERELKALNRVKEVRHPFLLSLDRIEVVDGQLVIVTELADMSLKDRFRECQQNGADGIPREELIGYLHDAADALDYMSQHWSLQHLDVKPENLLLVGGRVKVADFGLVQNIANVSVSLLGGLTPIYAPPELFEGRPGLRSDQYSLAIVYQEMLTGVLPFSGTTAAQLMTHHLRDRPRLSPLPTADRADIARALSKRPADRFPSCCTLVDALRRRRGAATHRARVAQPDSSKADPQSAADAVRGQTCNSPSREPSPSASPVAKARSKSTTTLEFNAATVETESPAIELPPVTVDGAETTYGPSLFLAIGGTAAMTMRQLRHRLSESAGPLSQIPAFQTLLIDTDLREIVRATQGEASSALQPSETIAIPLRNPREYREKTTKYLDWLSRRWLYNIPRSLQPEGRRPLGRLAFVDHAEHIFERIRKTLVTCTSEEALDASSAATGWTFAPRFPKVYLVASLAGGTGSGTVVDLAYAVRELLGELGLSDRGVCGILMHSTSRDADARNLAIANTCACLTELSHFSHPSLPYPGAPECGIAPRGEDDQTFANAYFVDLGDHMNNLELQAATAQVAEYIYRDAATPVRDLLEKCRETDLPDPADVQPFGLRSFGLRRIGGIDISLVQGLANRLCFDVLDRWRCGEQLDTVDRTNNSTSASTRAAAVADIDPPAPTMEQKTPYDFNVHRFHEQVSDVVSARFGGNLEHAVQRLLTRFTGTDTLDGTRPPRAEELLRAVDVLLSTPTHASSPDTNTVGSRNPSNDVDQFAEDLTLEVHCWLRGFFDARQPRTVMATSAATQLDSQLQCIQTTIAERIPSAQEQSHQAAAEAIALENVAESDWWRISSYFAQRRTVKTTAQLLEQYAGKKFDEAVATAVHRVVTRVRRAIAQELRDLSHLQEELNAIQRHFADGSPSGIFQGDAACGRKKPRHEILTWESPEARMKNAQRQDARRDHCVGTGKWNREEILVTEHVLRRLQGHWPELVSEFETQCVHSFLEPHGGLCDALAIRSTFRPKAATTLRTAATAAVTRWLQEINIADVLFHNMNGDQAEALERVRDWVDAATPRLALGGAKRLLLAIHRNTDLRVPCEAIARLTGEHCSVAYGDDGDVIFCYEVEQIPLENVLRHLMGHNTHSSELASRLHARVDVSWTPVMATP